jgi:predicted DNA-binding transcriptional regulator YafY
MDTLYRRWLILGMIPRHGNTVTVQRIADRLCEITNLEKISIRSVQRDMEELSANLPIVSELNGRTLHYNWMEGRQITLPGMDPHTALTFQLVNAFMGTMLPKPSLRYLEPFFRNAAEVLEGNPEFPLSHWLDRVRIVPRSLKMEAPRFKEEVTETVYDALLRNRRISASYRPRGEKCLKTYKELNPLGLVFVENLIYLLASIKDYPNPVQFLLHRMESATMLDKEASDLEGFSVQGYIESGEFSYPIGGKKIRLKALFDRDAAAYLHETPVPGTLALTEHDEEYLMLEADIEDSHQLRWWLKGFGAHVEVLEPQELRDEFKAMAAALNTMYA